MESGSESEEEDSSTILKESNVSQNASEKTAHYFVFSGDNKAGMHGYEKKKQAQIIYDMSKNSSFFKQAEKQDEKRKDKISETKRKVDQYMASKSVVPITTSGGAPKSGIMKSVEAFVTEFEARRDLSSIKVVVDMDMFFAAVAIRDRPHLKDKPVAIGGMSMISTSNYVARKFGVRSAMPGFIAKKLCPHLIFLNHESDKYKEASTIVKTIMLDYDPNLVSYSLDEFFMDLTAYTDNEINRRRHSSSCPVHGLEGGASETTNKKPKLNEGNCVIETALLDQKYIQDDSDDEGEEEYVPVVGDQDEGVEPRQCATPHKIQCTCTVMPIPTAHDAVCPEYRRQVACEIVQEFRRKVYVATGGLTCSAGIANNSFLAKIGADQNKPDGQFSLPPSRESILEFLENLPCRKIPGVGRVTENVLSELDLKTMGDIKRERDKVLVAFTPKLGRFLIRVSLGIDSSEGQAIDETGDGVIGDGMDGDDDLQKSIGTERTFRPMTEISLLLDKLSHICTRVHEDLEKHNIFGGSLTLKIKTSAFQLFTRSCAVPHFKPGIYHTDDLFKVAKKLFLAFIDSYVEESKTKKHEDGDDDVDAIQNLAVIKNNNQSQKIKQIVPKHSPTSSSTNLLSSHASVSIRLMGVQISKLGRFKLPGEGSIRDSKLGRMLLAAAPTSSEQSTVESEISRPHVTSINFKSTNSLGNSASVVQLLAKSRQSHKFKNSVKKEEAYVSSFEKKDLLQKKPKVRASVLDMMYCQPGATDLLVPSAGVEITTNPTCIQSSVTSELTFGGDTNNRSTNVNEGIIGIGATSGSHGKRKHENPGNLLPQFGDTRLPGRHQNYHSTSLVSTEPSSSTRQLPSEPLVEVSCPICQQRCKSLYQLNLHLDRNCEKDGGNCKSSPKRPKITGNDNHIKKYFGFDPGS
mmetsp:Transcript_5286/g.8726  ORF Transcript_5286/g.8726 Transcript_5286/m.8726 type:complete len:916 (-) Transcript_5286:87-2834(-)